MAKELIKVSLTEFINYVNKSGSAKATVVLTAKSRREEDYQHYKDYWLPLRNKIKEVHKNHGAQSDLRELVDSVAEDKQQNYNEAINGYCRFWGRKDIEWQTPPRKTWSIGNVRVELNPELGIKIKDKTLFIKLFINSGNSMDKRHADLILALMETELRDKVRDDAIFAILDVKRGKLFEYCNTDRTLYALLKAEARGFEELWYEI
jgi:hypothetical protein